MAGLTPKQREYLDYITAYWTQFGVGPTVREIAAEMGVGLNAVVGHLYALERKGFIHRNAMDARSIRPVRNVVACDCPHCGESLEVTQEFERG